MTYVPKVYKTDGGDTEVVADGGELTVESGGEINIESGGTITNDGTQATAIADAKIDYATPDLDTEAEIIAALNTTNGKINSIIAALEGVGILAAE